MPPKYHIPSTSIALFRVFIAPTLRTKTSVPIWYAPAFARAQLQSPPSFSTTSSCARSFKRSTNAQRHALSDHYVLDSAIKSPVINLVTESGEFQRGINLDDALDRVNKATHHLMQVTPGQVDAFGRPDPRNPPTCRVISKMALREQHQKKLDLARKQAKGTLGVALKQLELNWAIAEGDLKHRLDKLQGFLKEGKKVEIVFGAKRRGRKATEEEAKELLKRVRDAAGDVRGATEAKAEGTVGGTMTITFEGRKLEEKKSETGA